MNLNEKNVLVTGIASNRSISYAIAKKLSESNANVIIAYQNERLKDRVLKLKDDLKIDLDAYQCDLSEDSEILSMKEKVVSKYGNLDLLLVYHYLLILKHRYH